LLLSATQAKGTRIVHQACLQLQTEQHYHRPETHPNIGNTPSGNGGTFSHKKQHQVALLTASRQLTATAERQVALANNNRLIQAPYA
jgi:hypothetical protein